MIEGIGEAIIRRPPEAIIAFVTDLERYKFVAEPYLWSWLAADVREEMGRLKSLLEAAR